MTMKKDPITLDLTVNQVSDRYPATRAVLAAYGIDLCCGGIHSLELAAQAHGMDTKALLRDLNAAAAR